MGSILETINKFRSKSSPDTQLGVSYETGGVGTVRRDVQAEAIEAQKEQAAMGAAKDNSDTKLAIEEQRKQNSLARDQEMVSLGQQRKADRFRFEDSASKIMNDFEAKKETLSTADKLERMEVMASNLRLQDDQYRYNLADQGRRQRLNDSKEFDNALKRSIFEDNLDITTANINFKKLLDLDDIAFSKQLKDIDLDSAWEIAKTEQRAASQRAAFSAGGSIVTTVAGAYAKSAQSQGVNNTKPVNGVKPVAVQSTQSLDATNDYGIGNV